MVMRFQLDEDKRLTVLKVVGIGGAGGNAVNRMVNIEFSGADFIAMNTDLQVLRESEAQQCVQLGEQITRGLGSGGDPELGRKAAEESREVLREQLQGADMIFLTAGMGGGTGTGASPVIAAVARETGALTVGVVTKPFFFEGDQRLAQAETGIEELRKEVDTLLVIPNDKLLAITEENTTLIDAFSLADEVLCNATRGISDLITRTGVVNLDFADVRSVMSNGGNAVMGTGIANGEDGAKLAAETAISSPLLDNVSIKGASDILVNITGSSSLSLQQVSKAATIINKEAGPGVHVFLGAVIDDQQPSEEIRVTVIATGFNVGQPRQAPLVAEEPKKEINFTELLGSDRPVVELSPDQPVRAAFTQVPERAVQLAPVNEASHIEPASKPAEEDETIVIENGSIRSYNTDKYRVPTFVRKQMD
ncbi:MAG: cell division protein FtsZ [bacterium]|nr:cell division protein FtsZ [bacterium]